MGADSRYPVAEEVRLATQGDKEAAGRLAQAGILLPCPFCKSNLEHKRFLGHWYWLHPVTACPLIWCAEDSQYGFLDAEKNNTMWNTRNLSDFESEEEKC